LGQKTGQTLVKQNKKLEFSTAYFLKIPTKVRENNKKFAKKEKNSPYYSKDYLKN